MKKTDKLQNVKNFHDLEEVSDIEKSQKSTFRKLEEDKKDMLFKIVTQDEISKLQEDIEKQMKNRKYENRQSLPTNLQNKGRQQSLKNAKRY